VFSKNAKTKFEKILGAFFPLSRSGYLAPRGSTARPGTSLGNKNARRLRAAGIKTESATMRRCRQ
jgi:hypothetical protein